MEGYHGIVVAERSRSRALLHGPQPVPRVPRHVALFRAFTRAIRVLLLHVNTTEVDPAGKSPCWRGHTRRSRVPAQPCFCFEGPL